MRNEKEGCGDHDGAPCKDAAGDAAFVLHKELLERAVENDADDIREIVERGNKHHRRHADETAVVANGDAEVENCPRQSDARGAKVETRKPCTDAEVIDRGFDLVKIRRKLLETAAADARFRRELCREREKKDEPEQIDGVE